jgi:membrane-bound inhibitor of C-type lysozyme
MIRDTFVAIDHAKERSDMDGKALALSIVAAVLAGCSTSWLPWSTSFEGPKGAYTPPGATAYSCEGSKRLLVRFESGGKSAWAIYPDREVRLERVTSASGEEFSRAGTTWQSGTAKLP